MTQREYIGSGSINRCKEVLAEIPGKKVFLVTGKKSYAESKAKKALSRILSAYEVTVFNDIGVNPTIEGVKSGIRLFKRSRADIVIAVGGGNAIDTAKLINFYASNKIGLLKPFNPASVKKARPLIAIPTTAGSGSEATHFAVVYKRSKKYSVGHKYILPDFAIIDPDLTRSLCPRQAAISGIDALSQAVESYWSVNSTKSSIGYAREAIKLILPNFVKSVKKTDKDSREAMAKAAHLAGKAINITKTTAPHAVSYPLTAYWGISHGHAVALTLGRFFIINSKPDGVLNKEINRRSLEIALTQVRGLFGVQNAKNFAIKWKKLLSVVGLETDFRKLGVSRKEDINRIIRYVDKERLMNNPIKVTTALLKQAFEYHEEY